MCAVVVVTGDKVEVLLNLGFMLGSCHVWSCNRNMWLLIGGRKILAISERGNVTVFFEWRQWPFCGYMCPFRRFFFWKLHYLLNQMIWNDPIQMGMVQEVRYILCLCSSYFILFFLVLSPWKSPQPFYLYIIEWTTKPTMIRRWINMFADFHFVAKWQNHLERT